jgi:membrane protease subunit HflC
MGKIIAGIIVAIAAVAFFSIFIVKEVNQAIVLQFGDPKRIISKPGLNFKIPFIQNVVFLDKRILNLRYSTRRSNCIRSKKINCRCFCKISNC